MSTDNIKVAIKSRPLIEREKKLKLKPLWNLEGQSIYQIDESGYRFGEPYHFDHVFTEASTNQEVYDTIVQPFIRSSMEGFNTTIFAYGQTSSGKTHTMMGGEGESGIIQLAVNEIFDLIEKQAAERQFLISCSYFELCHEKIIDLLEKSETLKIREDHHGNTLVNAMQSVATTSSAVIDQMKKGNKNRKIESNNVNERSSRSHTIFRITIESKEVGVADGQVLISQLNLVDLAGSERVAQTKAIGDRLKEGVNINKSLSVLGNVIRQLSESEGYINYRDSKLTRILQSSLGGNAKSLIIATITTVTVEETKSTLEFAQRAKTVKNKPKVNEIITKGDKLREYELQNSEYKRRLKHAEEKILAMESQKTAWENEIERLKTEASVVDRFRLGTNQAAFKEPSRRHTVGSFEGPYIAERNEWKGSRKRPIKSEDFDDAVFDQPRESTSSGGYMKTILEDSLEEEILSVVSDPEAPSPEEIVNLSSCSTPDTLIDEAASVGTPIRVIKERFRLLEDSYISLREFTNFESQFSEEELSLVEQLKIEKENLIKDNTDISNILREERQKTGLLKMQYEGQLDTLKDELETQKAQTRSLTLELDKLKSEMESGRLTKLQEVNDLTYILEDRQKQHDEKVKYLTAELEESHRKLLVNNSSKIPNDHQQLTEENTELKKIVAEYDEKIFCMHEELSKYEAMETDRKSIICKLYLLQDILTGTNPTFQGTETQTEFENIEEQLHEKYQIKCRELLQKIEADQVLLSEIKYLKETSEADLLKSKQYIADAKKTIDHNLAEKEVLQKAINKYNDQIKDFKYQIDEKTAKIVSDEKSIKYQEVTIMDLRAEILNQEKESQEYKEKIEKNHHNHIEELEQKLRSVMNELSRERSQYKSTITELQVRLLNNDNQFEQHARTIANLEGAIEVMKDGLVRYKEMEMSLLSDKQTVIKRYEKTISEIENRNKILEANLESLTETNEKLNSENRKQLEEKASLEKENENLESTHKESIAEFEKVIKVLKNDVLLYEGMKEELKVYNETSEALNTLMQTEALKYEDDKVYFEEQLRQFEEKVALLNSENEQLILDRNEQNVRLRDIIERLTTESSNFQGHHKKTECLSVEQFLEIMNNEMLSLKLQNEELRTQMLKFEDDVAATRDNKELIETYEKTVSQITDKCYILEQKLQSLSDANDELNAEILKLRNEKTILTKHKEEFESTHKQLKEEIRQYKESLAALTLDRKEQNERARDIIEGLTIETSKLQGYQKETECLSVEQLLEIMKNEIHSLGLKNEELLTQKLKFEDGVAATVARDKELIETYEKTISQITDKCNILEEKLQSLSNANDELNAEILNQLNEKTILTKQQDEFESTHKKMEQDFESSIQQLSNDNQLKEEEIKRYKESLEALTLGRNEQNARVRDIMEGLTISKLQGYQKETECLSVEQLLEIMNNEIHSLGLRNEELLTQKLKFEDEFAGTLARDKELIETYEKTISQITNKCNILEEKLQSLRDANDELNAEILKQLNEKTILTKQNEEFESTHKKLEQDFERSIQQLSNLSRDNQLKDEEIKQYKESLEALTLDRNEKNARVKNIIEGLVIEISKLHGYQKETECMSVEQLLEIMKNEILSLGLKNEKLLTQKLKFEDEFAATLARDKKMIETYENTISQITDKCNILEEKLQSLNDANNELNAEILKQQNEKTILTKQKEEFESTHEKLEQNFKGSIQQLSNLSKDNQLKEEEIKRCKESLEALTDQLKLLQSEIFNYQDIKTDYENKLKQLEDQIVLLIGEKKDLLDRDEQHSRLMETKEKANMELEQYIGSLKHETVSLRSENEQLLLKNLEFKSDLEIISTELKVLKESSTDLKRVNESNEFLEKTNQEQIYVINTLHDTVECQKVEIAEQIIKIENQFKEIEELKAKLLHRTKSGLINDLTNENLVLQDILLLETEDDIFEKIKEHEEILVAHKKELDAARAALSTHSMPLTNSIIEQFTAGLLELKDDTVDDDLSDKIDKALLSMFDTSFDKGILMKEFCKNLLHRPDRKYLDYFEKLDRIAVCYMETVKSLCPNMGDVISLEIQIDKHSKYLGYLETKLQRINCDGDQRNLINNLETALGEQEKKYQDLNKIAKALKKENKKIKASLKDPEQKYMLYLNSEQLINKLKGQLKKETDSCQDLFSKNIKFTTEILELENRIDQLEKDNLRLRKLTSHGQEQELSNELERLKKKYATIEVKNSEMSMEITELRAKIRALAEKEIGMENQFKLEKQNLQETIAQIKMGRKESPIPELKGESITKFEVDTSRLSFNDLSPRETRRRKRQSIHDQYRSISVDCEKEDQDIIEEDIRILTTAVEEKQKQIKELNEKINNLSKENGILNDEVEYFMEENKQLKDELKMKGTEEVTITKQVLELQQKLLRSKKQIKHQESQIRSMGLQIHSLNASVEEYKCQINNERRENMLLKHTKTCNTRLDETVQLQDCSECDKLRKMVVQLESAQLDKTRDIIKFGDSNVGHLSQSTQTQCDIYDALVSKNMYLKRLINIRREETTKLKAKLGMQPDDVLE